MKLIKRPLTKRVFIYGLKDPESGVIRYVGKTKNLKGRFWRHLHDNVKTHKGCWLNSLKRKDLVPTLEILENCLESEWVEREKFWIKHYKDLGNNLTNATEGGEGGTRLPGSKLSVAHCQAISKGRKGIKFTEEHKAKIGLASKGRKLTEEHKLKISLNSGLKGKPRPDDVKLRISQKQKGRKFTDEHKLNISISKKGKKPWNFGKKASEEHKLKLSIIHKNRYKSKSDTEKQRETIQRVEKEGRAAVIDQDLKKGRMPKTTWTLADATFDSAWSAMMGFGKDEAEKSIDAKDIHAWFEKNTPAEQLDLIELAFALGKLQVFADLSHTTLKELWKKLNERASGKIEE